MSSGIACAMIAYYYQKEQIVIFYTLKVRQGTIRRSHFASQSLIRVLRIKLADEETGSVDGKRIQKEMTALDHERMNRAVE